MKTIIHFVSPLEMLSMSLVILTPGQGFWFGVALAKYSFQIALAYRLGCTLGLITLYGILNEIGQRLFTNQASYAYLDVLRGVALFCIGCVTLYQMLKKKPHGKAAQTSAKLEKLQEKGRIYAFGFGTIWTFMNPVTYILLTALAPPFVQLQHHWLIYAAIIDAPVTLIYSTIYYFIHRLDRLSNFWYGKLLWSSIACIPIYYGLSILLKKL